LGKVDLAVKTPAYSRHLDTIIINGKKPGQLLAMRDRYIAQLAIAGAKKFLNIYPTPALAKALRRGCSTHRLNRI
jgi:hypothetical protein